MQVVDSKEQVDLYYIRHLAIRYLGSEVVLDNKQTLLLDLIFKGRESQRSNVMCLGEALDIVLKCKDIEEEIKEWQTS